MKTIAEFIEAEGLAMKARRDWRTTWPDGSPLNGGSAWICTITRPHYSAGDTPESYTMETPFFQGSAHTAPPTVADVLDCLAMDGSGYQSSDSFEEWCAEYGYDTDSRKAKRTYRAVERQSEALRKMLGTDAYETLLWETERE